MKHTMGLQAFLKLYTYDYSKVNLLESSLVIFMLYTIDYANSCPHCIPLCLYQDPIALFSPRESFKSRIHDYGLLTKFIYMT
jgi:hypothetical protein